MICLRIMKILHIYVIASAKDSICCLSKVFSNDEIYDRIDSGINIGCFLKIIQYGKHVVL